MVYKYVQLFTGAAVIVIVAILAMMVLTAPRQTVVTHWDNGATTQTVQNYQLPTQ